MSYAAYWLNPLQKSRIAKAIFCSKSAYDIVHHCMGRTPMEKLLEHFGYATPFIYAAAAYGLFYWLDENASEEAKKALASTMKLKSVDSEQVAAAIVEVFDGIYT